LADFDFEEIKYVPGSHNVVPNFLSRPWDSTEVEVLPAIHVLAACTSRRTQKTAGSMPIPSVVVLPSWHRSMTDHEKHHGNGLWSVTIQHNATSHDAACREIRALVLEKVATPRMTCVAHTNGISLWRADFRGTHRPTSLTNPCQCLLPANLPSRKREYQPHFEVLTYVGVWGAGDNSTVFNVDNSASVGLQSLCAMKITHQAADLPVVSTLLHDIRANILEDAFWGDVLQAVLDSDDNFYRDFFLDDNRVLCFRRTEDVVARVCVPALSREAVLRSGHGDSLLAGHPGIDRTIASVAHSFYCPGLHADVAYFV